MYSRKIKLLRALLGNEKLSSAALMDKLRISQRTLRMEVREINDILNRENIHIHSLSMGGYYIKKEEKAAVQKQLDRMIRQTKQLILPETPHERFIFGFTWLFFQEKPVSIQRAAEELYTSNTAMLRTKKKMQNTADEYACIRLETSKRGMWISGTEEGKRHVLAQFINYWTYGSITMERLMTFLFDAEHYERYTAFYQALPELLLSHGHRLADKSVEGLSLDVFLSLVRQERRFLLEEGPEYQGNACIEDICAYWEPFGYTVPKREKAYFEECLNTRRVLYVLDYDYGISEECQTVTEEFLRVTDRKYHTAYMKNPELVFKISVHIAKMLQRLQKGYFETNSILNDVIKRYGKEMEMADGINPILKKRYHLTANVHEVSYLAVYLRAYSSRKLKAIVLCDLGEGIADNMIRQITNHCGERIQLLDKMSLAEYRLNPIPADLLISCSRIYNVDLPEKTKVIYVDYLLKEEHLKKIQDFLLKSK